MLKNEPKNNKSPDPDQTLKCQLLIKPNINAECLQYIFSLSLKQNVFAGAWKIANNTLVYKRDGKKICDYCPV